MQKLLGYRRKYYNGYQNYEIQLFSGLYWSKKYFIQNYIIRLSYFLRYRK